MTRKDYLSRKDSELVIWGDNFVNLANTNATAWGIPKDEITALQTAQTEFKTLQAKADSPAKTSIIVAEKNASRKRLVTKIRAMVDFRMKNPVITDAQRIALGLHVQDKTHTPIPAPHASPALRLTVQALRRISAEFRDPSIAGKAKPYGVNGAVIVYAVLAAPPANPDALAHSVLATRTPHTLEFAEEERGKTVYVAACWQNEKGQKGPWSEIESAIIP
ncbi:MAG: hypothetical protein LBP64_08070 [Tannerella sp.]|jgi:hypothetical protein|nr:hypothetical protein [Tannerella sp.]